MILRPVRSQSTRSRPLRGLTQPYQWTPNGESKASDQARPSAGPPRKPGVLVVEGEGSVRTVLGLLLRQHGFVVWQAGSANEAQEIQAEHADAIDVVLVDTALPKLDTPGLVRALRDVNPQLYCCLLSSQADEFNDDDLRELGITRLFTRPFPLTELVKELRLVVAREPAAAPVEEPKALVIDVAEPPGDERRGNVRYRCELENSCQPLGQGRTGEHWQGQVVDISAGGARILLNRRFEVGTVLVLSVTGTSGDNTQRLLARVVRVIREPDGQWSLGCSFNCPLPDDDLRELLG